MPMKKQNINPSPADLLEPRLCLSKASHQTHLSLLVKGILIYIYKDIPVRVRQAEAFSTAGVP